MEPPTTVQLLRGYRLPASWHWPTLGALDPAQRVPGDLVSVCGQAARRQSSPQPDRERHQQDSEAE